MLPPVVRRLALLSGAPLAFLVAAPAHAAVPVPPLPPTVTAAEVVAPARLMSQVVTKTNQLRFRNGCRRKLAVDRELTIASVRQSIYMANTGRFSHIWRDGTTFVARSHAAGYAQPSGENIAWGYQTADEVVDAWMLSPSHRANILNCSAHAIGTGVVYGANGIPYYTQVFGYE